jgi:uncharacterized repeat protein (TIGR01451 family)
MLALLLLAFGAVLAPLPLAAQTTLPPTITKTFGAASIPLNGTTSLTFTIGNPNAGTTLVGVSFVDVFPAGLVIATPNGLVNGCVGAAAADAGATAVGMTGATLAASASCTFSINVVGTVAGLLLNTVSATSSSSGGSGTNSAQLTVIAPPIANPVSVLVAYDSSSNPIFLSISGGAATSVAVGSGPAHGTTSTSGTTITYTPNTGFAGPDSFTYTATNIAGTSSPATVTITVAAPPITLTPASLPAATVGVAYSQTVTASGGAGPYAFAITSGSLPAGLHLSSSGTLSGPPTAGGTFTFTVTAIDSSTRTGSQAYTLTVNAPTISVAPATLPNSTIGTAYSQTVSASGGTAPYTFAITAGALPVGLTLSSNGTLSGPLTAGGTFNFTITATDSSTGTGPFTGSRAYSITVVAAPTLSAAFSPTSVAVFSTSIFTVTATNPNSIALTNVQFSNTVPAGLTLVTQTGGTCGTLATLGGIFSINPGTGTYSVTSNSLAAGASCTISVRVRPTSTGPFVDTTSTVTSNEGPAGAAASATLTAIKADQTITFNPQGAQTYVPGGVFTINPLATSDSGLAVAYSSITASVCTVSGINVTIVAAGTCTIAADQAGNANYNAAPTVTQNVAIGVASQTITFTSTIPTGAKVGGSYTVSATGGASGNPVTFSIDAASTAGACAIAGSAVSFAGIGNCIVDANQAGNANYAAATQVQQTIAVGQDTTTMTLSATPNPSVVGQSVTLTATVAGDPPTGTVNFTDGSTVLCSNVALVASPINASATCVISNLTVGNHPLAAAYSGDTNYVSSTATLAGGQTVNAAASGTTLTSSLNPSLFGQNVQFTATVTGGIVGIPTGTIVFSDGGTTLASVTLDATGHASYATATLSVGAHTISASYGGDTNNQASSASLVQRVTAVLVPAPMLDRWGMLLLGMLLVASVGLRLARRLRSQR